MPQWRLLFLAWVTLFGLALTTGHAQDIPNIVVDKYELANGLDVILYQDHSLPVVSVNVWYHVGSKNEQPGRTGLAHLFEHMMFQGSQHHDADYFQPLQAIGGVVNGSTTSDRTNYWQDVPSNYLELVLWLEADRLGFLLPAMTQEKLDNQRDVVKNERRQRYDNQPYGKWQLLLPTLLYPLEHPYSWTTIGSMEDLSAASLADVQAFFRTYYIPNNASLVIAGDFNVDRAKHWVEQYFASLPAGAAVPRLTPQMPELAGPRRLVVEDNVALPRLYYAWHTPAAYTLDDAAFELLAHILTQGKGSRLSKALIHDQEVAQDVNAWQWSRELGSTFHITATLRTGQKVAALEQALDAALDAFLHEGITATELEQAKTAIQASFIRRLEHTRYVADQLNAYNTFLGAPNKFAWDLQRFTDTTVANVMTAARRYLEAPRRVKLILVPSGEASSHTPDFDRSVSPQPQPEPGFTPPAMQRAALPNGLEVLVVEDHSLPLVEAHLVMKSGWAADPPGRAGTAALTAKLLEHGTQKRDLFAIATEMKRLAADFRTMSTYDNSTVRLNVLRQHLHDGLALLADVVQHATLPEASLEHLRRHSLGRVQQEVKEPRTAAFKIFHRVLYGSEHPYGQSHTGSGTATSLNAIRRDDIVQYYHQHYVPNNAALILVGDTSLASAIALAEQFFGTWQPEPVPMHTMPAVVPRTPTQIYLLDKPGAAQSMILVGGLGLQRRAPAYYSFLVLHTAFGGKFQSRINLNLREDKGYTYGARTVFQAYRGIGPFAITTAVQTPSTGPAVREIVQEIRALLGPRPFTETELEDAKSYLIKGFPRQFETLREMARQLDEQVTYDLPDETWARYVSNIRAVTAAQTAHVAGQVLNPDALLIVVVGDRATIEADLRALALGEVQVLSESLGP